MPKGTSTGAVLALGFAGQVLFVVPEREIVVVVTCRWRGLAGRSGQQGSEVMQFVARQVSANLIPGLFPGL